MCAIVALVASISSGVFIPRRRINTGGAVAVTKRRRGDTARARPERELRLCEMLSYRTDVDVAIGVKDAL